MLDNGDWRLVGPAAAAWLAAWCATQFPGLAMWLAIGLGALGLLTAAFARAHALIAAGCVALAACALVAGAAAMQGEQRIPEPLDAALGESGTVEVRIAPTGLAKPGGYGWRVPARLIAIDGAPASAPVMLFAELPDPRPGIGAELLVEGSLEATDPGDRTVALVFADEVPEQVAAPHPVADLGNRLRSGFVDLAAQLPRPGAMLVPGLAVGDESLVDDALDGAMKTSSLSHLTAVSGSNIAIIVVGIVWLGRLAGWSRTVRIAAAGLALAVFVLLVTPQGSVIRATAMAVLVLVLEAVSRPVGGVPVLALAVIALLAVDPWLSHDYGFALSAAATAGLLFGTRPLSQRLERWLPPPLAMVIAVPLAAQLACQPILLMLEPAIPLYGVVANLLAAPAAPPATVIGLLACLLGAVWEPAGLALAWVAWLPAQWIALIAQAVERLPGAALPWFEGGIGVLSWLALSVAAVILLARAGPRRLRRAVALLLALALTVLAGRLTADALIRARDLPEHWRVLACDIGQGDAVLVRGGGATVLIDTGEDAELLQACFAEFGIDRVDLLVLSHFDIDHSGGVEGLRVPVGAAWVPDTLEARAEPTTHRLQQAGVPVHFGARGDVIALGDLVWTALSPPRAPDGGPSTLEGNDSSLAVHAAPTADCVESCLSLVSLGDLGERAQRELLVGADSPEGPGIALDADVVKVSHHGSRDQHAELYSRVRARIGLISVGAGNGYGHPTDDVLAMLAAAGTPWLRTDLHGHAAVFVRDGELAVWTSRTIEAR